MPKDGRGSTSCGSTVMFSVLYTLCLYTSVFVSHYAMHGGGLRQRFIDDFCLSVLLVLSRTRVAHYKQHEMCCVCLLRANCAVNWSELCVMRV